MLKIEAGCRCCDRLLAVSNSLRTALVGLRLPETARLETVLATCRATQTYVWAVNALAIRVDGPVYWYSPSVQVQKTRPSRLGRAEVTGSEGCYRPAASPRQNAHLDADVDVHQEDHQGECAEAAGVIPYAGDLICGFRHGTPEPLAFKSSEDVHCCDAVCKCSIPLS